MEALSIPREFIWRRVHSLMGLWLVLFLIEHLVTNSQAALWLGEDGRGFVRMVNLLHDLPYLQVVETVLIGIPLVIHLVLGVRYALSGKSNSRKTDGSTPSLPRYGRNRAYTWQRITSWILLLGLIGHVAKFRFLDYPYSISQGSQTKYFVKITPDAGLESLAERLGVTLYTQSLPQVPIVSGQIIAESLSFGTATLLTVRDAFKTPLYLILYTIFVLAACFHAFNGFWTFLITWGLVIRRSAQRSFLWLSWSLIGILSFLGLAAIWGTWFNLSN